MPDISNLRVLSTPQARYDKPQQGGPTFSNTGNESVETVLNRVAEQAGLLNGIVVIGLVDGPGMSMAPVWFSEPIDKNEVLQLLNLAQIQFQRLRPGLVPQAGYVPAEEEE